MRRFTLQSGLLNARFRIGPLSQPFLLHYSPVCQNSRPVLWATHQPLVSQRLQGFPLQASVQKTPMSRLLHHTWSQ